MSAQPPPRAKLRPLQAASASPQQSQNDGPAGPARRPQENATAVFSQSTCRGAQFEEDLRQPGATRGPIGTTALSPEAASRRSSTSAARSGSCCSTGQASQVGSERSHYRPRSFSRTIYCDDNTEQHPCPAVVLSDLTTSFGARQVVRGIDLRRGPSSMACVRERSLAPAAFRPRRHCPATLSGLKCPNLHIALALTKSNVPPCTLTPLPLPVATYVMPSGAIPSPANR